MYRTKFCFRWGDTQTVESGDVHFYDKSNNCLDPALYPRAKFISEYGYQSYPSFSVYKQYTELKDWSIDSNMSDYRCTLVPRLEGGGGCPALVDCPFESACLQLSHLFATNFHASKRDEKNRSKNPHSLPGSKLRKAPTLMRGRGRGRVYRKPYTLTLMRGSQCECPVM